MGKSCGTVGGNEFSCLDDVRKLKVTKKDDIVIIDGGPWGRLELPCLNEEWQEMLILRLFLESGKFVDEYHVNGLLEKKRSS